MNVYISIFFIVGGAVLLSAIVGSAILVLATIYTAVKSKPNAKAPALNGPETHKYG